MSNLKGQNAIVTGTTGNLGPIWCRVLEELGARVFKADPPDVDVISTAAIEQFISEILTEDYAIHILINNAAIDNPPGSEASFFGNWRKILDVNLGGAIRMCEAVIPHMLEDGGTIINIGSIQGYIGADWRNYEEGFEKPVGYNVSKAALLQLSRSINVQYGRYGVRACTIGFGAFDSPKLRQDTEFLNKYLRNVPLGRTVSEESVTQALKFALLCPEFASDALIDGGYTAW